MDITPWQNMINKDYKTEEFISRWTVYVNNEPYDCHCEEDITRIIATSPIDAKIIIVDNKTGERKIEQKNLVLSIID